MIHSGSQFMGRRAAAVTGLLQGCVPGILRLGRQRAFTSRRLSPVALGCTQLHQVALILNWSWVPVCADSLGRLLGPAIIQAGRHSPAPRFSKQAGQKRESKGQFLCCVWEEEGGS